MVGIYIIQGDIILLFGDGSKLHALYAHVLCMSELCCQFQSTASNILGVVETKNTFI